MDSKTALCQLAEIKLDRDLPSYVAALRVAGWGWRRISTEIHSKSGIRISHEALRQWFRDDLDDAA